MSDFTAQTKFFEAICRWGLAMVARGYVVTGGDWFRDPRATFPYDRCPPDKCFHRRRLAFDPNLFRNGVYITTLEGWQEGGELWEKMGGTWGGRFGHPDPNHLSWGE